MVTLRPYQSAALDAVRAEMRAGRRRVVLQLPTGGGKTVIAAHILSGATDRGLRSVFLAHRRELVHQASARLSAEGVSHGVILAGEPATGAAVQVASVQTIVRRTVDPVEFVFVDECHHTPATSYRRILDALRPRWVVGLSATPYRTDGRGLGDDFDALVRGPSTEDLTRDGWLAPCDVYSVPGPSMGGARRTGGDWSPSDLSARCDRPEIVGDLLEHWRRLGRDLPTVAFAVSVDHATRIAETFGAAGVPAALLTGTTPHGERARVLEALATGSVRVVANCAVLTEGWDCPVAACALVARPTLSRGLWRQMVGRVLRTAPGKARAVILDHGGCVARHGHPYEPDEADLSSEPVRFRAEAEPPPATRICAVCYGVAYGRPDACPYCHSEYPVRERRLRHRDGTLERVDWSGAPMARHDDGRAAEVARGLSMQARDKGYRKGWVYMQLRIRYGETRARELMRGVGV
jgi:DNA repair protein RadD